MNSDLRAQLLQGFTSCIDGKRYRLMHDPLTPYSDICETCALFDTRDPTGSCKAHWAHLRDTRSDTYCLDASTPSERFIQLPTAAEIVSTL